MTKNTLDIMDIYEQLDLLDIPYLDDTLKWINSNSREWKALQKLMLDIVHEEPWRKRVKRDEICTETRKRGISIDLSGAWEFDHNLWANIARYLIKYHPLLDGKRDGIIHVRKTNNGQTLPDISWFPDLDERLVVSEAEYQTHRFWRNKANG